MLGPAPGRYLLRDEPGGEPVEIVAIETLGAPRRHLIRGRASRPAENEPPPAPVATTRATVVDADPLDDAAAGDAWLSRLDLDAAAEQASAILNRVMQAHRIATADPHIRDLTPADSIALRAGYGDGERVADGRWSAAREAPLRPRRVRRSAALQPTERLAALLGARDVALACEELVLRARLDFDAERIRAAAPGVRLALEAALVELAPLRDSAGLAERLRELHELRDPIVAAANAGLIGPLTDEQRQTVGHALQRTEAILRARTVFALRAS